MVIGVDEVWNAKLDEAGHTSTWVERCVCSSERQGD